MVQEEAESDGEDDLPDISCLNLSPGHDKNDQTHIQLQSTSKHEPELGFPGAHSGDVLGEIAAAANRRPSNSRREGRVWWPTFAKVKFRENDIKFKKYYFKKIEKEIIFKKK